MTSATPLPQAPRVSLVESAIALIRTHIESGAWKVGERIPKEQELAEMLQVGRNTVREAVRVLAHANVLEVRQGDGTYVRTNVDAAEVMLKVTRGSMRDLCELRAMLEAEAARLAAHHRTEADIARLRRLLMLRGERRDAVDAEHLVDADLAFHSAIAQICGNRALADLYRYFTKTARQLTLSVMDLNSMPEPDLAAHFRIVDAIEQQDDAAAAHAARAVLVPLIEALSALE